MAGEEAPAAAAGPKKDEKEKPAGAGGGEGEEEEEEEEHQSIGKNLVNPDIIFDRYRESRGVSIKRFLKFCRDALLIDNSWTYYDAILAFDQLATDDADDDHFGSFAEEEEEYSSRFLDYDGFIEALRRIARQSSAVEDTAQLVKSHIPAVEAKDAVAVKWFAFRHYVGETLHASPKSDDDFLLMEFIFSEPVIRMIVENEYKFRRAYKRLAKQMGKIPKWEDLATHRTMKMDQNSVQKFLRDLVGKEHGGPIRQEDWSTALRASNHETTSKDTSAKTSGETTLPELMEMVFRCAMGGTLIGWSMRDENAEDGSDKRYFDTERDTPASACERIEIILEFVWDWLEAERERDDKPDEDHTVLMEECPLYDTVHADLQRIFMHYSTGARYTDNMDHSNPLVMMPSENLFRFCRDSGFMDARVTYSAIFDRYTSLGQGKGPWQLRSINYAFFCRLLSGLARLKYEEARAVVAITMLLEQWLIPMVNIPSQTNELKEFMFTEQMLSFFLIYELHVGKMFDKHATIREVRLESSGVVNIPGSVAASALQEPHRRIIKQVLPSLGEEEPVKEEKKNFRRKQVKSMTLIDLNGFLKTLGFVPDMLTVDEVPEIFDTVVASTPHLQMAVSDSTMCLSQLLEALTSAALIMYSRPPYSSKYATREEKVLATLERVEVCYYSLFKKFMPLEPKASFPSADLTLIGVSKESQLRDFLITRRMERGMSLVSVSAKTHLVSETEGNVGGGNLGSREYAPVPERSDGRRPVALGMPSIIREQLFAPEAPYPVGPLMETALIHHNAARYKASVETYLQALNTWNSMLLDEGSKASGADQATAEGVEASGQAIDDIQLLFFFTSLGGVYESAGLDELALACYTEGRLIGDKVKGEPEQAVSYSAMGNVLFHLGQYSVAMSFFEMALKIREESLGERHMDTGLLYNNIGACYDMLNRVTEAIESYSKGCDVFRFEFGLTHPRTATAMRNLTKVKQRRFDFHVSFATRKPTPCPAKLLGGDKKKKGKKGGKKGGKGGKKKK